MRRGIHLVRSRGKRVRPKSEKDPLLLTGSAHVLLDSVPVVAAGSVVQRKDVRGLRSLALPMLELLVYLFCDVLLMSVASFRSLTILLLGRVLRLQVRMRVGAQLVLESVKLHFLRKTGAN